MSNQVAPIIEEVNPKSDFLTLILRSKKPQMNTSRAVASKNLIVKFWMYDGKVW